MNRYDPVRRAPHATPSVLCFECVKCSDLCGIGAKVRLYPKYNKKHELHVDKHPRRDYNKVKDKEKELKEDGSDQ